MGSIYLPYQKPPRWNIGRAEVAHNCARMGLPMPAGLWVWPGGNWPDLSGNRINGTITGAILKSGSLYFDGTDDYVDCGASSLLKTTSFTLFVRFKYDSVNHVDSSGQIIGNRKNNKGYCVAIEESSKKLWWATTLNWSVNYTDFVVSTDDWHNLIFVYNEYYGTTVYVDGVQVDYDNTTGANTYDATSVFALGRMVDITANDYSGFINIVAYFPKVFTLFHVATLNNNPYGMFEPIRSPAIWSFAGGQSASLSDNFNLSETFTPLGKYSRTLSDNMNLSETTSPIGHFLKAISDTLFTTDALSVLAHFKASTSDTLNLTDSITVVANLKGTLSDTITLTDNLAALLKALASLSDILTLTDSITYPLGQSASLLDTLSLTDSSVAKATLLVAISDIFSLTDTTNAIASLKVILSDTFNLSDDLTTKIIGNLTDTLTLTDSVTNMGHFLTTLADTLSLSDSNSGMIHFKVSLSDTLTFSEQISALASYAATIVDTLNLTDEVAGISVTITGELTITFSSSKPTMVFSSSKPGITFS